MPKKRLARRGVAAVELAVLLPLLLLLLLGVWEVGRMVEVQQLLANGAREAGRQASTGVKTVQDVKDVLTRYLNVNGIPTTNSTITVTNLTDGARSDPSTANQLDQFRITVSVPIDNFRWALLGRITPGSN